MSSAIERARRRLDAFMVDPGKHALHAAKVLIKFRLLEVQATAWADLDTWLRATPYFGAVIDAPFSGRRPSSMDPRLGRGHVPQRCLASRFPADIQRLIFDGPRKKPPSISTEASH